MIRSLLEDLPPLLLALYVIDVAALWLYRLLHAGIYCLTDGRRARR